VEEPFFLAMILNADFVSIDCEMPTVAGRCLCSSGSEPPAAFWTIFACY
jgi:hypothetical protein